MSIYNAPKLQKIYYELTFSKNNATMLSKESYTLKRRYTYGMVKRI